MGTIREPIVEGIFYPSDKAKLKRLVDALLGAAAAAPGEGWGIIAPHAGYRYSGAIAAAAFQAVARRKVKTVVILAPLHRSSKHEVVFSESDRFRMPQGLVSVDRAAIEALADWSTQFVRDDIPHLEEHGIEVQLPFVSALFPRAAIVPILVGQARRPTVTSLARALRHVFDGRADDTLYVVSANLTAFLQGPAARAEADQVIRAIRECDAESLLSGMERGTITSCGLPAIAALLLTAGGRFQATILSSGNSGEVNRDFRELTHYAAVAFNKKEAG